MLTGDLPHSETYPLLHQGTLWVERVAPSLLLQEVLVAVTKYKKQFKGEMSWYWLLVTYGAAQVWTVVAAWWRLAHRKWSWTTHLKSWASVTTSSHKTLWPLPPVRPRLLKMLQSRNSAASWGLSVQVHEATGEHFTLKSKLFKKKVISFSTCSVLSSYSSWYILVRWFQVNSTESRLVGWADVDFQTAGGKRDVDGGERLMLNVRSLW